MTSTFTTGLESLEPRTLLTAGLTIDTPTLSLSETGGGSLNGSLTDAEFATGADATISWNSTSGALAYDILIYDVNIGQEVLNPTGMQTTSYSPASLTNATRYQVFSRGTGNGEFGNWSSPVYFDLMGQSQSGSEIPGTPSFNGLTTDTPPALDWTSVGNNVTYELLV